MADADVDIDLEAWEGDVVLADGGTVHVRPIRPDDGDALVALHGRLSPESIYYRFFSPKPRLSDKEVHHFTHVDFVDRVALVAVLGDEIISVARYDRWRGRDEAEVAFVVDDAHQGRGISTVLLEHLSVIARSHGITGFTAEVLADNRPMLAVFKKAGFDVTNAFSGGIIDVAFDIVPTARFLESVERREQRAESRSIARLVRPKSIAVIGASDREGSVGRAVIRNLLTHDFDGPVYPVNRSAPHVASVPAYPTIGDIPDDIHLAVVAVGTDSVRPVVEECAAKRVRGVIVIATGFADAGPEGMAVERDLVEFARRHGMRIIGPASMGLIATGPGHTVYASFAGPRVRRGRVAIALQSGPLGAALLDLADRLGIGISSFVSFGNRADVSANDFLNYWDDDPDTGVVLLYTESFGNPRKFGRIARRVSRTKPIVAVKAYRSDDDVAADALYQQAGVIRVDSVRQMLDMARVLAHQPLPTGRRVAVVANAASPAVLAFDSLTAAGLVPAGRAVDLTYTAAGEDYRRALTMVLSDVEVHAAIAIYAPPIVDELDEVAAAITETAAAYGKPVLAVTLGGHAGPVAPGSPVPVFDFPEPAVRVLARVVRYAEWRARPEGTVPELPVDHATATEIVSHALEVRPAGTQLPLTVAADLLASHGIPVATAVAVTSLPAALRAAGEIGYPVTLKVAGPGRFARSESGGVALDIQSEDGLVGAYQRMTAALGPAMAEAMVQRMVPGGVETIVTVTEHPAFGPIIGFGLGGVFAEAIADRSARSLPLTDFDARALVAASRASVALAEGADVDALYELLVRIGILVDKVPEIAAVHLNPVLVTPSGVWVVDWSMHVAPPRASPIDVPLRRLD